MGKLQLFERHKLHAVVVSLPEFVTGEANLIHAFLSAAGLAKFCSGLNLSSGIPRSKVAHVIDTLEAHGPLVEYPDHHALGALLGYLLTLPELPRENAHFVAQLIVKYRLVEEAIFLEQLCQEYELPSSVVTDEAAPAEGFGNTASISDKLRQRRVERSGGLRPSVTGQYNRLNYDRILRDYDMTKQVANIKVAVLDGGPAQIVHLTTAGDPRLLFKYLFPRAIDELRRESSIRLELRQISIAPTDLLAGSAGLVVVEQRLASIYSGLTLRALANAWVETKVSGCLLCIENQGVPPDQVNHLALTFQSDAVVQLQSVLQQTGSRLVVCWINPYGQPPPLEIGQAIPIVDVLDATDVTGWFAERLHEEGVAPADVAHCMRRLGERLAYSRGSVSTTYLAMEELLQELSI